MAATQPVPDNLLDAARIIADVLIRIRNTVPSASCQSLSIPPSV